MSNFTFGGLPKAKWELKIGPTFRIYMQTAPNAFHRLMQLWLLGFVWTRQEEEK